MKAINKEIAKLVIEIIVASCIIFFTHFIWDDLKINNYRTFAANSYMHTLSLTEDQKIATILLPMTDEEATNQPAGRLTVENLVNEPNEYSIFLVINKNSTLDYKNVSVIVDSTVYRLSEQNRIEDEESIYITLNTDYIKEKNTHEVRIYLNSDIKVLDENKILNYYFEIKEDNNLFAAK